MPRTFVYALPLLAAWLAWKSMGPLPSICGPPLADGFNQSGRFAVTSSLHP